MAPRGVQNQQRGLPRARAMFCADATETCRSLLLPPKRTIVVMLRPSCKTTARLEQAACRRPSMQAAGDQLRSFSCKLPPASCQLPAGCYLPAASYLQAATCQLLATRERASRQLVPPPALRAELRRSLGLVTAGSALAFGGERR